jgi:DNA-binding transcriptional LysR family regulator
LFPYVDTAFTVRDDRLVLDINDLRVFECVARRRSFSAAARELATSKSGVSNSVARLEATLAVRLLQRTTREVSLTEAGEELNRRCASILQEITQAVDHVGSFGAGPRGVLKISVGITFGQTVLASVLPVFLAQNPGVRVILELSSRRIDLVAEGFDVALRMGALPDSGLVAKRLGSTPCLLCAAPSYLARCGHPGSPDALASLDTVEVPGADGRPLTWLFTGPSGERLDLVIRPRVSVNDPGMVRQLLLAGAGVGLLPAFLCNGDLAAGTLVRLLPDWQMPAPDVHAVFPSGRALSPSVRAFVDLMSHVSLTGQSSP